MTIKELRDLSDEERREVRKDWLVAIALFTGTGALFALLAMIVSLRM